MAGLVECCPSACVRLPKPFESNRRKTVASRPDFVEAVWENGKVCLTPPTSTLTRISWGSYGIPRKFNAQAVAEFSKIHGYLGWSRRRSSKIKPSCSGLYAIQRNVYGTYPHSNNQSRPFPTKILIPNLCIEPTRCCPLTSVRRTYRGRGDICKVGVGVGEDLPAHYQDDDPTKKVPQRRCGILLHPTSLPGAYGIGELGKEAFIFLDWLKSTGCTVWQVLPLGPPGRRGGEDGSPYAACDVNCGNTLLISLEELVKDTLLEKSDLPKTVPTKRVNYETVAKVKDPLISKAAKKLANSQGHLKDELDNFRKNPRISIWLEEAALFAAIDHAIDAHYWWDWPEPLRDRNLSALDAARHKHKDFIHQFIAEQFLFQRQWQAIHKYANNLGIKIVGDMPIYVGGHSADVWAHRSMFALDQKTGVPTMVSGVPPDAFSATGQLWGSPLYSWKEMAKDRYAWWVIRMRRAFELYDEFRIDHFRGLAGYWAIPATAETAISGKWKAGPREDFFNAIKEAVGKVDIIAEDLGIITGDVVALRKNIRAPGMAVLQFAFGSNSKNPHLPHNHEVDQVVYPGTHDNDTCVGWWKKVGTKEKENVKYYLQFQKEDEVHWEFIRASIASVARTSIIPMQDLMGVDNSGRMNTPATQTGNWGWRVGETGAFQRLEKERDHLYALLSHFNRLSCTKG